MDNFKNRVIEIIKRIPYAQVASYGQIAALADSPRAARIVGYILRNCEDTIPWWRVINSNGFISIRGNELTKDDQKFMLEKEGIKVTETYRIDIKKYGWLYNQEDSVKASHIQNKNAV